MSVVAEIQELKKRVFILKGVMSPHEAALAIGINGLTLREWLRGTRKLNSRTLEAIERWCDHMEAGQETQAGKETAHADARPKA